jgi:hypothetical protein
VNVVASIGRAALLLAVLSSSACLFGEVRGIPCDGDDACPETYFCDLPRAECRERSDVLGPPDIKIEALLDPDGDEVRTPFLPPETTSSITLLPKNVGLAPAESIGLTFGVLACFTFDVDETTLPDAIAPNERAEIVVAITPGEGCEGLTIIDWFLTFSGRETRGVFDVNVKETL